MASQTRSVNHYDVAGWDTPENAYSENDLCTFPSAEIFQVYNFTNNSFSIPAGATIDGIEVKTIRGGDENDIYLIELQDKIPAWKLKTGTAYQATCANGIGETLGDPNDLWGGSWDAAHINSSSFQLRITWSKVSKGNPFYVDHIEVTVYYTMLGPQWMKLEYFSEPPSGNQWNKLRYESEPPVQGAWNKLKYGS